MIPGSVASAQTQKEVRLIAYNMEGVDYWIATNHFDLTAVQIAKAYKIVNESRNNSANQTKSRKAKKKRKRHAKT